MGPEASWSLADIPSSARDAAKAAALREGVSVGEWLTQRIFKRFSEMSSREQEEAFNDLANRIGELNDRLDQFEDKIRIEPLREAVKKLHQGMTRLSADLVQTSGRSAIELSALAGTVESLNVAVEQVRANATQTVDAFGRHIAELQTDAQTLEQRSGEAAREIASRMGSFAGTVDDLRTRLFQSVSSSERSIAFAEQGLHDLDVRSSASLQALTTGFESLSAEIENGRKEAIATTAALNGRIHAFQQAVDGLDAGHAEHARLFAAKFETLGSNVEELRDDAAGMCGALDQRLLLVQQALQSLDARQSGVQVLEDNVESLSHRVENIWTKMSSARASIEERLAHAEHSIRDINQSYNDGLGKFDKAQSLETTLTAAIASVENGLAELRARFADCGANNPLSALEHTLSELTIRTDLAEASLRGLLPQTAATGAELKALGERLDHEAQTRTEAITDLRSALLGETGKLVGQTVDSAAQKQQSKIADLRKELLGETGKLICQTVDSAAQKQQGTVADLRKELLDETGKFVGHAIEAATQKQQNAIAEIRIGVLDEALRTVSDQFEAELRVQQEAFAEWKSRVLEEAVEAIGAKLESQSRIQQDAIAGLKTSLLDLSRTLSERLESAERKQDDTMAELRAELATPVAPVQPATTTLNATAEDANNADISPGFAAPVNFASGKGDVSQHVVLELSAAMQEGPLEDGSSGSAVGSPSPTSETAHSESLRSHQEVVSEPLQPTAVSARDAIKQSPPSSSYLSAARHSLQAAAVRTDTETSSKDLFGIRFLHSSEVLAKRNGETTSYALLAGIALVTILAVLIAISQFMGRSTSLSDAGSQIAPALVSTHSQGRRTATTRARHLAIQRPLSVAEMQSNPGRLAMLANMGNAQAQLLLGVHDLGTNDAEAAKWLAQAAAQGDAQAQYRLGALYAAGRGVKADAAMALRWYQAAANAGDRKAMFSVALAYAQGQGTAKNPQQAARWFEKAAQLGLVDAQFNLAVLYERGLGVPQSLTDAYRWYAIAAKVGDRESKDRIDALASQLSPSNRASAEAAAEAFKPLRWTGQRTRRNRR